MAVGRHLAVAVEVVQQHELPGQAMGVGRDLLREDAQVRVAVAVLHVAEDLIVGAVLADDVDAVLDRDWPRRPCREWGCPRAACSVTPRSARSGLHR